MIYMKQIFLLALLFLLTVHTEKAWSKNDEGAYTYWTADGQKLPLPEDGRGGRKVPADAVAVDLRGWQAQGITAAVDVMAANPNCLYYLDNDDALPEGLTADLNVIQGLQAECVRVIDGYDYYCPLSFNASFISYLQSPLYDNPMAEKQNLGYSQTLVLPFNVSCVLLYDVNDEADVLHEEEMVAFRYIGCSNDTLQFSRLSSVMCMQAYTPYVLGVYVGSHLLFIGENTQVPMTREAVTRGRGCDFVGTTVRRHIADAYLYSAQYNGFIIDWAGQGVEPFRAAFCRGQDQLESGKPEEYLWLDNHFWGDLGRPGEEDSPCGLDRV